MTSFSINSNKAVVFDLDGTLIDTSKGILNSVRETISYFGYSQLDDNDLMSFLGGSIYDVFQRLFPEIDSYSMVSFFRKRYEEIHFSEATSYDGIYDLLKQLKELGFSIGVATLKREDLAKRLLSSYPFYSFFDVICGSDAEGLLTKTDIICNCLKLLQITNNQGVTMVGDVPNDAKSANLLGIPFLGVTYGYGFKTKKEIDFYPNVGYADKVQVIFNVLK